MMLQVGSRRSTLHTYVNADTARRSRSGSRTYASNALVADRLFCGQCCLIVNPIGHYRQLSCVDSFRLVSVRQNDVLHVTTAQATRVRTQDVADNASVQHHFACLDNAMSVGDEGSTPPGLASEGHAPPLSNESGPRDTEGPEIAGSSQAMGNHEPKTLGPEGRGEQAMAKRRTIGLGLFLWHDLRLIKLGDTGGFVRWQVRGQ